MSDLPTGANAQHASQQTSNSPVPRHLESYANYKEPYSKRFKRYRNRNLSRVLIGVELVFSLALVGITGTYTYYAGKQKDAMIDQLKEMKSSSALQKKTAAVQFGLPVISINWLGMFELGENKSPYFIVRIQNNGKTNAESTSLAMDIKFSDKRPEPNFTPKDFQHIKPGTIEPWDPTRKYIQSDRQFAHSLPGDYSTYKSGKTRLYMLGMVKYKNYTNLPDEWDYYPFCRYVTADVVQISTDEAHGYSGPYQDCSEQ